MIIRQGNESDSWKPMEAHLMKCGNGHTLSMKLRNGEVVFTVLPKWLPAEAKYERLMGWVCWMAYFKKYLWQKLDRCYFCHCDR